MATAPGFSVDVGPCSPCRRRSHGDLPRESLFAPWQDVSRPCGTRRPPQGGPSELAFRCRSGSVRHPMAERSNLTTGLARHFMNDVTRKTHPNRHGRKKSYQPARMTDVLGKGVARRRQSGSNAMPVHSDGRIHQTAEECQNRQPNQDGPIEVGELRFFRHRPLQPLQLMPKDDVPVSSLAPA